VSRRRGGSDLGLTPALLVYMYSSMESARQKKLYAGDNKLTNSLLQYVLTCMIEPPEEVLPAARARARHRYAKILRLAGQEVATRNKATLEEVLTGGKQP